MANQSGKERLPVAPPEFEVKPTRVDQGNREVQKSHPHKSEDDSTKQDGGVDEKTIPLAQGVQIRSP